jgi:hypothetical protein
MCRIMIQVHKPTKKIRIICHFEKRFDLISILKHFAKWQFDCDFKYYFQKMI